MFHLAAGNGVFQDPTIEIIFWAGFSVFVVIMLALDLGVFHRKNREIGIKESLIWTGIWIALALAFGGIVWAVLGHDAAINYYTSYLIEKSLSMDNIFVFLMLFQYFRIENKYQHEVLFWGIIGALLFRLGFIFAGTALLSHFHWMFYVFGAFLIFTGGRLVFKKDEEVDPERNPVIRLARRFLPVTQSEGEGHFFIRENGKLVATRLFLVLIAIETTDLIFAIDSIAAILAITQNTFIIYSAMTFAILGLRALYFALAGLMQKFTYLHYGLAAVLAFVGIKMVIEATGVVHIPAWASLVIVLGILTISIVASIFWGGGVQKTEEEKERQQATADQEGAQTAAAESSDSQSHAESSAKQQTTSQTSTAEQADERS